MHKPFFNSEVRKAALDLLIQFGQGEENLIKQFLKTLKKQDEHEEITEAILKFLEIFENEEIEKELLQILHSNSLQM